jgi:hypothetical protein
MLRKTNIEALKNVKSERKQQLVKLARESKAKRFANLDMA